MQTGLQHVWLVAQDNIKIRRDKHRASPVPPTPTLSPLVNPHATARQDTLAPQDLQTALHLVKRVQQVNIRIRRDKRRVTLVLPTPTPSPLVNLDVTVWWDTPAAADMQTGLQLVKLAL